MAEQGGNEAAAPVAAPAPPAAAAPAPAAAAAPAAGGAAPASKATPAEVLERLGTPKGLSDISEDQLKAVLQDYYDKWVNAEDTLYDVQHDVKVRDLKIQELEMEVSDMRGKFMIPKLKKVHNFKLMGGEE